VERVQDRAVHVDVHVDVLARLNNEHDLEFNQVSGFP
jgi:hypothetical protein